MLHFAITIQAFKLYRWFPKNGEIESIGTKKAAVIRLIWNEVCHRDEYVRGHFARGSSYAFMIRAMIRAMGPFQGIAVRKINKLTQVANKYFIPDNSLIPDTVHCPNIVFMRQSKEPVPRKVMVW